MRMYFKYNPTLIPFAVIALLSVLWLFFGYNGSVSGLFITPDQAGQRAYNKGEYKKAAALFENSDWKGAALFRAGEFKKAKAIYQTRTSKEGKFNLGNTLVMLGLYDNAIKAYELALKIDPDFKEAQENLVIAEARKKLKEVENSGEEGVGKLGADKIVFDNKENKGVEVEERGEVQSAQNNPQWLDRLQTGPKEFLKNKFAFQYKFGEEKQ
ncbi:tetratricopeptide repeat protein [Sulfurovum sp. NBC37-1]|uniref:tetratricopeptide repeat protein n=1 Tax=Sulfurovum sp. (strain NBC37-1) TaxID=387093 RepID=UPI0001587AB9|nr:tetratricopeptide repeat protein [Sulfurovum sp. NBC37-1]BAF73327.1 conserved hypothetical protein [Sulfurovum sp. NBC37-1]